MTDYPQNQAYEKTCASCRFASDRTDAGASAWTLICKCLTSKHYDEQMKPAQGCGKYETVDTRTGTLF